MIIAVENAAITNPIYIPIWLNSNGNQKCKDYINKFIYIPIWLNSNNDISSCNLHPTPIFTFQYG